MKKFLVAGLMLASFNVFSQSYLILSNGVTLTTDKAGFIYDFGHFHLPYKVSNKGTNYFVEEEKLSTIDENGYLYEKSFKAKKLKGTGGNFFVNDDSHLVTIDTKGFYYEYEEDTKIFKKITAYGGNYFLVKMDKKKPTELYTVNDKGNYFKLNVEGLNPDDITTFKGNYFQTKSGTTYTISTAGFVFPKPTVKTGTVTKAGANYFVDSNKLLYTVSQDGLLILPVLPMKLKIDNLDIFGANYMIDKDGRIFIVDKAGNIFERTIKHDLRNAKIFSR